MIYLYIGITIWVVIAIGFSVLFDRWVQEGRWISGGVPWRRAVFCVIVSVGWPFFVLVAIKRAREAKERRDGL